MATKPKILIIDADNNIAELISLYLTKECYDTKIVNDGEEALLAFESYNPNMILLDLMLPGIDGYQVCREVRTKSNVPIIMLSAKGEIFDKVLGLELGADDYMTKPFGVRELMARVKANLRRLAQPAKEESSDKMTFGALVIDNEKYEVSKAGQIIDLTVREFELLKFLAAQPDKIFTRENLLEKVWGYEYYGDLRTVDVTVRRLREKLEDDPAEPTYIMTKRGVGYLFKSQKGI
jgi:DNA-binding response OmpR family regulator